MSTAPRRVMIDARYLRAHTSGIGRYTEHIVRHLLALDDQLELELITHPTRPEPIEHERVRCQMFRAAPNSLGTRWRLARAIDLRGAELFHSPFNILPAGIEAPCVFTLHDIMWLLDPSYCTDSALRRLIQGTFYGQLIPRSVEQAARIMTVSDHSRQAIEERFPEVAGRVHVTYNGLDPFFYPVPEDEAWAEISALVPPRRRFVLVVGQGSPYKNHAGALAGFLEAFRHDPQVYFVLVRRFERGPARRLKQLMEDPALNSRLISLEYVTGPQLRALYSAASCFLFPSLYEGFGLPPLEAMACGTPVLTSDRGAPAEVSGPGAVCVDPEDPEAIGAALRRLLEDPDHHAQVRRRGLAHAATFTWRRCAEQVLQTYRQTLS